MPLGGKLTIETANVEVGEAHSNRQPEQPPGRYVMLSVADTGVGMDEQTRARIFEPFFSTKEFGKGTGLGLATVYGIVKQSDGYIWVESEPGRGTTFRIFLPLTQETAGEPGLGPAAKEAMAVSETILLVEDEQSVRELTRKLLEKIGYRVLIAGNGEEALEVAERHQGRIHLVITDLVMPRMSGRALAERLRKSRPETPVLYVSGYTDDAWMHHWVEDPSVGFLQKPFTKEALESRVRGALEAALRGRSEPQPGSRLTH